MGDEDDISQKETSFPLAISKLTIYLQVECGVVEAHLPVKEVAWVQPPSFQPGGIV